MEDELKGLLHFSHEHSLEQAKMPLRENKTCSACKLTISPGKFFYHCQLCQFFLHKLCYNMPRKVQHAADPKHHLSLSATPSDAGHCLTCQACGKYISGFSYDCIQCKHYYHMLCLAVPLSVKLPSSHPHLLKLEFEPPYDFQCDLCDRPSYCGWLYRCRLCEFDAHVSCAVTCKGTQTSDVLLNDPLDNGTSKQHELMELLTEGMEMVHQQFQPLAQSNPSPVPEATPLHSAQYSDACFSLDIARSIGLDENPNGEKGDTQSYQGRFSDTQHDVQEPQLAKSLSFDLSKRGLTNKREAVTVSTRLGSHVWNELGQENKKGGPNSRPEKIHSNDQRTSVESRSVSRSFWSKILMCF